MNNIDFGNYHWIIISILIIIALWKQNIVDLTKVILSSIVNIFIYFIIIALFLGMGQGHVIPIAMYTSDNLWNVLNILLFHGLMFFLGMLMSLYPTYIFAILFGSKNYEWKVEDKKIIYYKEITSEIKPSQESKSASDALEQTESAARKLSAMLLFIIWSWVLVNLSEIYHYTQFQFEVMKAVNTIMTIVLLTIFYVIAFKERFNATERKKLKRDYSIRLAIKIYSIVDKWKEKSSSIVTLLSIACIIILISLIALTLVSGWSGLSLILQLILTWLFTALILFFRSFRSELKSRLFTDDVRYLNLHRVLGICVLAIMILINSSDSLSLGANALNVVLIFLVCSYTIIVLPIKLILFLYNKQENNQDNFFKLFSIRITRKFIPWMILFLMFPLFVFPFVIGNKMHSLSTLPKVEEDSIANNSYITQVNYKLQSIKKPILYAAYGGGLMANYWNLLILDSLDRNGSFGNILAMSGVSGGGMGIGLFTGIKYMETVKKDPSFDRADFIEKIGASNILGLELPWVFGWDLIRECIPYSEWLGHDRSHRTMTYYADQLGSRALLDSSMYKIYHDLFTTNGFYPNIIFNSTSAHYKYGVVSPINANHIFSGAENLLELPERKTLTYLESVSTCNRFPLVSPAARVEGKGYFLDGGYFENSGLMSLISFKKFLEFKIDTAYYPNKFTIVSVRNSKENYLIRLIQEALENKSYSSTGNLADLSEIYAIVKGAINLERLPNYLKETISDHFKDEYDIIPLDLPYYITTEDLTDLIGKNHNYFDKIWAVVDKSNNDIVSLLNADKRYMQSWGIINPPTSRVLSKPVKIYMENMMKHPNVTKKLNEISALK